MSKERPYVLSLAGFDPSGGAGILADIKTFESLNTYGLGIITANTLQTDTSFYKLQWIDGIFILDSLEKILGTYSISVVKIGIIENLEILYKIVSFLKKKNPTIKIIWDPVLKSSTSFDFVSISNTDLLNKSLEWIDLITPNYHEILKFNPYLSSPIEIAEKISSSCNVLLKGGHNLDDLGTDVLFIKSKRIFLTASKIIPFSKHGSGCVLSSAIAASYSLEMDWKNSCINAKKYIEKFLTSTPTLLGYHHES